VRLLVKWLAFDRAYAQWLSENLWRLTSESRTFLKGKGKDSFLYVLLSLVTEDLDDDTNRKSFEKIAEACKTGMHQTKIDLLKKGVSLTNDRHVTMSVKDLRIVIQFILMTKSITQPKEKERLSNVSLDLW